MTVGNEAHASQPGRVAGKVAIVTGAANGIGRGGAERLGRGGAAVALADVDRAAGEVAAEAIRSRGEKAIFIATDLREEQQCVDLVEETVRVFGGLHILVNDAGWFPRGTLEETTSELWDSVLDVNLRSAFYCCKHAVPRLRVAGGGSIINMGSSHGIQGLPNLVAYSAAKGGLLSMTRTLAGALAPDRIRVNYLIPGWVLTETEIALQLSRGMTEEDLREAGERQPLGRHQRVEDVAYAVIYLASDESSQVTAAVLNVDAGITQLPVYREGGYVG